MHCKAHPPSLLFFVALFAFTIRAMADTSAPPQSTEKDLWELPDILVTADRIPTAWADSAAAVESISVTTLSERGVRTLPEALNETVGVMVQKTAYGQGSPYIRGFTGFRTLLLVDGIRLNHPVFRDGPNQYWNTVDGASLDRLEILKGAGSILYGSDAVGGTVQAFTRTPEFSDDTTLQTTGNVFTRLASAERSATTRIEATAAEENWALLGGIGYKTFGALQGGSSTGKQRKAGYDEWDMDFKLRIALNSDRELIVAYQRVKQDDIWRTHRTPYGISWNGTTIGTEKRHVFDHERQLAYVRYIDSHPTLAYDTLSATLYWQRQTEDKDVIKKNDDHSQEGFDVNTFGTMLELTKETGFGVLVYGGEWIHDSIDSYRLAFEGQDGFTKTYAIQGPVGDDAAVDTLAAFAEHRTPIGTRWTATPGGRITWVRTDIGRFEDLTQTPHAPASLTRDWTDFSGSFNLARHMLEDEQWTLYSSVAQSFRAPNLSDLTRFGDSRSGDTEIPSPDIDPEHFTTFEFGSRVEIGAFQWHAAYFYTWIDGLSTRVLTDKPREFTKINGADGHVHGFETSIAAIIGSGWTARGGFTWMEGYTDVDDRTEYVRTMPMTAFTALRKTSEDGKLWAEILVKGVDKEDRLTTSDKGDTQRIPPGGTPGFVVCNLRTGWRVTDALSVGLAMENVLDKDYRIHGSGSNEPGRNLILTASCTF